jgi:hypothetical protein
LQVAVLPLSFSANAHAAPAPRPAKRVLSETYGSTPLTAATPSRAPVIAYPAGRLGAGRVGQLTSVPAGALPRHRLAGEGLLELTMSAPQTSWASATSPAVVVQARVDRGPWQQIVLFAGAQPFTYQGFTGPLRTGRHTVTVRVRRDLSHVSGQAIAVLAREDLRVVPSGSSAGLALAHAPVLYGRRVSSTRDTPLITYATSAPDHTVAGGRRLTYVVTWSHEDAGTGFVPWLEWGTWGRMTDIETAISLTVDRRGRVHRPVFLTCVTCGAHFPENRTALDETDAPFRGRWFGGHPILRVATGNNDLAATGTTPLRFQQALAAPPASGDTREGAMDRNPWTYGVMGEELRRDRDDYSTAATSAGPGDPRQYLIVALDTTVTAASGVGVELRLAGSAATYSNDLGTTYPLYVGGAGRTVVKVPLALAGHAITAVTLRPLAEGSRAPAVAVHRLRVLQYVNGRIVARRLPPVRIVAAAPPGAAPGGSPAITAR